jgi:hypothetical protein
VEREDLERILVDLESKPAWNLGPGRRFETPLTLSRLAHRNPTTELTRTWNKGRETSRSRGNEIKPEVLEERKKKRSELTGILYFCWLEQRTLTTHKSASPYLHVTL